MTGIVRRSTVIGLGLLIMMGTLSPLRGAAETPTPTVPGSSPSVSESRPSQSTSYKLDKSPFSLLVSPTRLNIGAADVGKTYALTVVNKGQAPLTVDVQTRDFVPAPDGSLHYQDKAPFGAAAWLKLSSTKLQIESGATQIVTADVRVSANPDSGDHQAAIVFMVAAGKTTDNIKINRGVAIPVFVTVPGPVDSSVNLTNLSAPGFAKGGPVDVTATITNVGTVHRDFRAPSPLTVEASGDAQPFPDFTVPRGAARNISTTWDPPLLCICHVSVSLQNTGAALQTQTVRVIVFPWHLLLMLLGAIVVILLLVKLYRRHYRAQVLKAAALRQPAVAEDG